MIHNTNNLFSGSLDTPLAERLRPNSIDRVIGQEAILGAEAPIGRMISSKKLSSLILWGPPGTGKTTIAKLISGQFKSDFIVLSAVSSGVSELRNIIKTAKEKRQFNVKTILFIDEIHRFNRSQQDIFLPHIEDGTIILIGATTENPSFEINSALLSRLHTLLVKPLSLQSMEQLIIRAEKLEQKELRLQPKARSELCEMAGGDARYLLNMVEEVFKLSEKDSLDSDGLKKLLQNHMPLYDKAGDGHYNLISALHKSLRGSDVDASLYWLARMLEGGEDPRYIARRLIRFSSEDIGLADPQALVQAIAAFQAFEILGSPEGDLSLVQAVIYLATSPKSNSVYISEKLARNSATKSSTLPPPKHILYPANKFIRGFGHGDNYQYDHDTKEGFSGQTYFPDDFKKINFYNPTPRGFEAKIRKRLNYWDTIRNMKTKNNGN